MHQRAHTRPLANQLLNEMAPDKPPRPGHEHLPVGPVHGDTPSLVRPSQSSITSRNVSLQSMLGSQPTASRIRCLLPYWWAISAAARSGSTRCDTTLSLVPALASTSTTTSPIT